MLTITTENAKSNRLWKSKLNSLKFHRTHLFSRSLTKFPLVSAPWLSLRTHSNRVFFYLLLSYFFGRVITDEWQSHPADDWQEGFDENVGDRVPPENFDYHDDQPHPPFGLGHHPPPCDHERQFQAWQPDAGPEDDHFQPPGPPGMDHFASEATSVAPSLLDIKLPVPLPGKKRGPEHMDADFHHAGEQPPFQMGAPPPEKMPFGPPAGSDRWPTENVPMGPGRGAPPSFRGGPGRGVPRGRGLRRGARGPR